MRAPLQRGDCLRKASSGSSLVTLRSESKPASADKIKPSTSDVWRAGITLTEPATNARLIFEMRAVGSNGTWHNGRWNQLWLNVTAVQGTE